MSPIDSDTVRRRLLAMQELVAHLDSLGQVNRDDLEDNLGLRLQVSMALAQLVTLATEVNSHVVTATLGRAPADQRSSFAAMTEAGWIERELARSLRDSPGLRNVVLHEYVRVDLDIVAQAIPMAVTGFGEYIRQVARKL